VVALSGPNGHPFYCGKTVASPKHRLVVHRYCARKYPNRLHSIRVAACGEHLTMRIIEVVPAENDWCARERFWIATIRLLYPGGTNIGSGGEGAPGFVHSAEFREKARLLLIQRNKSAESRARTSAALKGRTRTPEHCAAISAGKIGTKHSAESNARRSATSRGRKKSPETCAKIAAGLRGKKHSPERCAQNSALRKGVKRGPFSPETCAKISAHKTAYWAARRAAESASA
jgi:hypothetical protein